MPSNDTARRPIGTFQLLALGVNGIVGVGIFFIPAAVAASAPGFGTVWVFALTGLALLPVAVAFAHLGSRFDEDGGPVVFARAAFGEDFGELLGPGPAAVLALVEVDLLLGPREVLGVYGDDRLGPHRIDQALDVHRP